MGIQVFRSGSPGYSAILKHRYKDFLVNEIDGKGKVVELTSTDLPVNPDVQNKPVLLSAQATGGFRQAALEIIDKDQVKHVDAFLDYVKWM